MQRKLVLEGRNLTEKLAHVERILDALRNRVGRTVVGIIPPVPIMYYCAEPIDGLIAKLLIPISGVVSEAYVRIGRYDVKPVTVSVMIQSGIHSHMIEVECNRPAHSFQVDWRINAGDVVHIRGEGVGDVHIAFAVQPDMNRTVKERHVLEGLMALLEEDNGSSV